MKNEKKVTCTGCGEIAPISHMTKHAKRWRAIFPDGSGRVTPWAKPGWGCATHQVETEADVRARMKERARSGGDPAPQQLRLLMVTERGWKAISRFRRIGKHTVLKLLSREAKGKRLTAREEERLHRALDAALTFSCEIARELDRAAAATPAQRAAAMNAITKTFGGAFSTTEEAPKIGKPGDDDVIDADYTVK